MEAPDQKKKKKRVRKNKGKKLSKAERMQRRQDRETPASVALPSEKLAQLLAAGHFESIEQALAAGEFDQADAMATQLDQSSDEQSGDIIGVAGFLALLCKAPRFRLKVCAHYCRRLAGSRSQEWCSKVAAAVLPIARADGHYEAAAAICESFGGQAEDKLQIVLQALRVVSEVEKTEGQVKRIVHSDPAVQVALLRHIVSCGEHAHMLYTCISVLRQKPLTVTDGLVAQLQAGVDLVEVPDTQLFESARQLMLRTVQKRWGSASVLLFGSAATGMCVPGSDADLCVLLPDCSSSATESATEVCAIGHLLQERPEEFAEIEVVASARVPLVRCICKIGAARVQCDVVVNNTMGLCNTAIVQEMLQHNQLLAPLLRLVRTWTAQRCVRGPATANSLSMYSWTLLSIHALQQQGLLPWVDVISAAVPLGVSEAARDGGLGIRAAVSALINPTDSRPTKRAKQCGAPAHTVARCFIELLKLLLLDTRYRQHAAVSLRTPELLSSNKVDGAEAEALGDDNRSEVVSSVTATNSSSSPKGHCASAQLVSSLAQPGIHAWPRLRIEDPVELERDLGRYLTRKTQAALLRECARAYLMVLDQETTALLETACVDYEYDDAVCNGESNKKNES